MELELREYSEKLERNNKITPVSISILSAPSNLALTQDSEMSLASTFSQDAVTLLEGLHLVILLLLTSTVVVLGIMEGGSEKSGGVAVMCWQKKSHMIGMRASTPNLGKVEH